MDLIDTIMNIFSNSTLSNRMWSWSVQDIGIRELYLIASLSDNRQRKSSGCADITFEMMDYTGTKFDYNQNYRV